MIEETVLIVSVLCLIIFMSRRKRPPRFPPGPTSWPIVGNLLSVGRSPHIEFLRIGKKYGGIFGFDFGYMPCVVITDLKLNRQMLVKDGFQGRPVLQIYLDRTGPGSTYCRGLISAQLRHHEEQKKFILKNLRDFRASKYSVADVIQEEVTDFMDLKLRNDIGKPRKSTHIFNVAILNTTWRVFTGMRTYQTDPKLQWLSEVIIQSLQNYVYLFIHFAFPWISKTFPELSGYNSAYKFGQPLCDYITEIFLERQATYTPGEPRDIMDAMCEEIDSTTDPTSSFYKEEGVLSCVKSLEDIFVGGSDSVAGTMNWLCVLVSLHPETQDKIYEEIRSVVGLSRFPSLADRNQLIYVESVIMETLRFVAPLPLGVMHSMTETAEIAGYVIPKDTVVISDLWALFHDKDVWGDPDVFRPQRFFHADGSLNKTHEAFIPFSIGPRTCIVHQLAREMLFVFTANIFQKFKVSIVGRKPSLRCYTNLILEPEEHQLLFEERDP